MNDDGRMLKAAFLFFWLAIACALIGFAPLPSPMEIWTVIKGAELFKIGFVVFVVLFMVSLVAGLLIRP